jgi:hypothetical protein
MSQEEVHATMGQPSKSSEIKSIYKLEKKKVRLYIGYDESMKVQYLSVAPLA